MAHEPRAKIVRAQKKVSKGRPTHLQHHAVWSRILTCSVKSYVTMPSTNQIFIKIIFMRVLAHDRIEQMNGCEHSECHGLPVLCKAYLQKVVFENKPSDHET